MAFDMGNYQYLVKQFKKETANRMYLLLGLSGEVGELHSKAAKQIRDETPEDLEALKVAQVGYFPQLAGSDEIRTVQCQGSYMDVEKTKVIQYNADSAPQSISPAPMGA